MYGANKQAKAADQAAQVQREMYDQTRTDLAPWRDSGSLALGDLQKLLNIGGDPTQSRLLKPFGLEDFQASPGYQFRLDEGMKAINKGAASRGMYYAPQTLQDLGKYQQGLASGEFMDAYNRYNADNSKIMGALSGLSTAGQNAATQTGYAGQNAASGIGSALTGGAAAQAAGYMGLANSLSGGALGLANYGNYLSNLQSPAYSGGYTKAGDNLVPLSAIL